MMHFLAMGGYAKYVWPAYAVFFIVLAWDWLVPTLQRRRCVRELRGKLAREATRKSRNSSAEATP